MAITRRRLRRATPQLLAAACLAPCAAALAGVADERARWSVLVAAAVAAAGFAATRAAVPWLRERCARAGLHGLDLNKRGTPAGEKRVPEALGLAAGVAFLLCAVLLQQLHHHDAASLVRWATSGGGGGGAWAGGGGGGAQAAAATDAWTVDYNAALAAVCFMLLLGFADDVLDVPWRVKLALPAAAALPLLIAYSGGTGVVVPRPLRGALGPWLELGAAYRAYIAALVVFCANSINILAGVNGLEAGQTLVLACAVLLHNLRELAAAGPAAADGHLLSAYLMLPLAATSAALLGPNWFPASVFVGDTYTYFAGATLAAAGVLGHFSETLLLFMAPQVANFLYSLPQLLKIVPCPRHRLPRFDPATGLLHATPNMNLVNAALRLGGPCAEEALCLRLLALQAASCAGTFGLRAALAGWYK